MADEDDESVRAVVLRSLESSFNKMFASYRNQIPYVHSGKNSGLRRNDPPSEGTRFLPLSIMIPTMSMIFVPITVPVISYSYGLLRYLKFVL